LNPRASSIAVIAQDIIKVIPDAVRLNSEYIPNIMEIPSTNLCAEYIEIQLKKETGVTIKNKLRIMIKNKQIDSAVLYVSPDTKTIHVPIWENANLKEDQPFVYGIEVDDFHIVDKQKLGLLALGGVKELHQIVTRQENEISMLKEQVNQLIQRLAAAGIA